MQIEEVKRVIAQQLPVLYNNVQFRATACIMRLRNGAWKYFLELHDLEANAVYEAALEKVEVSAAAE